MAAGANCDGRTNGIFCPSADAESALLKRLYAQAGIDHGPFGVHVNATLMDRMRESAGQGTGPDSPFTDRLLTFDVSAHVGDRLLGEGTHQRAVIDLTRRR